MYSNFISVSIDPGPILHGSLLQKLFSFFQRKSVCLCESFGIILSPYIVWI